MAKIGFFSRIGNLWRGFLSLWIRDVENKHPEIAYENAINGMVEKYTQLKKATAAIIRRREDLEQRQAKAKKEYDQISADLNVAVETNQQDLGLILLQKKTQLETLLMELDEELKVAQTDADSAKSSLVQVQAEIKKLKAEKDNMLAKLASSDARVRINEQLEGLSVDAEVKALDNVREHIKNRVAQANLGAELRESDLDTRLAKLRAQTGDVTSKQQWEQLQQAAAAKKAASLKTM